MIPKLFAKINPFFPGFELLLASIKTSSSPKYDFKPVLTNVGFISKYSLSPFINFEKFPKMFFQIEGITVSDFAEDEHKIWRAQTNTTLVDREYDTEDFILQLDILGQIGISTIGADDVKDIKVTETGYEFKVLMGEDNEYTTTTQEVVFNVSKEGYITSFSAKVLLYTKSTDKYESLLAECTYKYSGVDFTALDAKIASLTPSA